MKQALQSEVMYLKGVGPQRAALLAERGILTVEDLLDYLPFRYEDRIRFASIREIVPGNTYTLRAEVVSGGVVRFARSPNPIYHLMVRDPTGVLHCKFFHGGYLEGRFKAGQRIVLHGKADIDPYRPARLEMINPQYELLGDGAADSTEVGRIVPIYEAIGSIGSRTLRRVIYQALGNLPPGLHDPLPAALLERYRFPTRRDALIYVHFPPTTEGVETLNAFRSPAHQRLIFEEFFFYQLSLAMRRQQTQQATGIAFRVREEKIREALKRILPFKPTEAQKRVLAEIGADLERPVPMNRLLQGDVGSGKTIVAFEAATIAMENACQAALMAPTEILAVQHYLAARRVFARAGYHVELLISGLKPGEKRAARARVHSGVAQFVVGTHALIEEGVEFARLGLVIVDEQHRFGVLQRKQLIEKGSKGGTAPHVLVMTATPIPRTLSLTLYGDLDCSVIDELPPGRTPVATRWTTEAHLPGVREMLRREVALGRQAYIVYPVIEESKQELKAAIVEYERLSKEVFPALKLGLLHGRLRSEEKEEVMERFRRGEIQVLVSTTVIEVGVDVPNATVMVVEHAERFGLAQLHQLRGRIGRGAEKSHCILVAPKTLSPDANDPAWIRLETMVSTSDGFAIAEIDLKLRGPGEFFGTRQHGELGLHLANPLRDRELLELARREAFALVENPDAGAERRRLLDSLDPSWQRRYQLATVG
ncbi:MAG: ATP-dependent DNA helicase RecG [Acidobacteria bacterium]|nr:ATP-dependent DNA helicase RecG [Acidobacteriota bacterium]